MVNKLSPARFASLLMGVWFLSTASANKFAGTLSALYPEEVKVEKSYLSDISDADLAAIESNVIDTMAFKVDPKGEYAFPVANVSLNKKEAGISIENIAFDSTSKSSYVSIFHMKLIRGLNKNFTSAVLISDNELLTVEKVDKKQEDGTFKTISNAQVWNLKPEKPSFAGFQVNTLYDFFMIFVVMAGAASVFLFFLSKRLLVLMNGIR